MIGDDSLVGPGCTIWQPSWQLDLSAQWVEATKKEDSDFYYECIHKNPNRQSHQSN